MLDWALMIDPSTFQTYEARPLCFYYTKCQFQGCWCTSSGVVNISLSFSASKSGHMQAASRRPSASFIHLVSYRFFDAALHCCLDRFPVKTRLMSDDMDSTCWSTYWTRCLRKALAAWPMQRILPSPFDETQTPDSLRIGLSENACFAMPVSDFR